MPVLLPHDPEEVKKKEPTPIVHTRLMVPTYDAVCGAQSELDELSRPMDGRTDGWGTEGNLG
jgi:hypothetical protein